MAEHDELPAQVTDETPDQVSDEVLGQVVAVAGRFGVGEVAEVWWGGQSGVCGWGEAVLRVARPGFEGDLRKEIAVIPVARAAGVLTPAIVEYDESRTVIDAPYVVMERVHGSEPTDVPTGLAEQLARLHRARRGQVSRAFREDGWGDPWRTVDDLAERGYVDPVRRSG